MTESRPPLHQPPNPDDLRRAPPAGPACAHVRGLLRDFADNDLGGVERTLVEEHVHVCFACSVELSRAEHEVLRLRRGFAGLAAGSTLGARLSADFARRVVERIVDETPAFGGRESGVENEAGAGGRSGRLDGKTAATGRHAGAANGENAPASAEREAAGRGRASRWPLHPPVVLLAAAAMVLVCLGVLTIWSLGREGGPETSPRLIVMRAKGAFGTDGRLAIGDGVGESQWLQVGAGGSAVFDWHDVSTGTQPAATIEMNGRGSMRLQRGAPLLVDGTVAIDTNRPVEIPVADGSTIQLGIGDYVITAEVTVTGEDYQDPMRDPLASAPGDLRIEIEVLQGQPARILGTEVGSTLVAAGSVGVYSTNVPGVAVYPSGTQVASGGGGGRQPGAPPTQASPTPTLTASVHQRNGVPSVGTQVAMLYGVGGGTNLLTGVTNAYGSATLTSELVCESDFAIVHAVPYQAALGAVAPDAFALQRQGVHVETEQSLVLDVADPLQGTVIDESGQPRLGVRVLPCIVDELFGSVFPLSSFAGSLSNDLVATNELGQFRIERLPATLPHYQHLALVLVHPELAPAVVPVPVRSGAQGQMPLAPVVMRNQRVVQLLNLPPHSVVTIWEEVPGLLSGTAIVQHQFSTDHWGKVWQAPVGWGELWHVSVTPGSPTVRRLVESNSAAFLAVETPQPQAWFFRPMENLVGTDLFLGASSRHERIDLPATTPGVASFTMVARDALNRPVPRAQVFAVTASGPRSTAVPRFLGLTSAQGVISLQPVQSNGDLVVVGPDASLALVPNPQQAFPRVDAQLAPTGRVLLALALRPGPNDPPVKVLEFRLHHLGIPCVQFQAVRFASEVTGWEFTGLAAGEYTVEVNGQTRILTVPPGGFVELQ